MSRSVSRSDAAGYTGAGHRSRWTSERLVGMSEFQQEIESRLESAEVSLAEARAQGDDYLAQVRLGEIESLQRLLAEHTAA